MGKCGERKQKGKRYKGKGSTRRKKEIIQADEVNGGMRSSRGEWERVTVGEENRGEKEWWRKGIKR